MTVNTKLVSSFAKFVNGDIKGGDAAHAFRLSQIQLAIEQTLKGNYDPMREAATLTEGKAKKARAYAAGFQAIATGVTKGEFGTPTESGKLERVPYIGALTLPTNKAARDMIATQTATALRLFDEAFSVVIAEKAAPKAKKEEAAPAPAAAPVAVLGGDLEGEVVHTEEVDVADIVDTVVTAITMGALSPAQVEMLRVALASVEAAQPELMAA